MKIRQVIPTLVTLTAMMLGFLSIMAVVEGFHSDNSNHFYRLSSILIMLSMILDGLDGNLARYLKATSDFGAELDTYVDLTAFGIAPAILIFAVSMEGHDATHSMWRVLLPSAVCLSGVVRLARFKAKDPLRGQGGYAGLPITANAAWVALFVFISQTPPIDRFSLSHGQGAVLFLTGVLVFIVLQVTNIRYPKPTKNTVLFSICCLLVALFFYFGLNENHARYAVGVAIFMLSLGLLYIMLGPLFVKGVEAHRAKRSNGGRPDYRNQNDGH